MKEEKKTLTVDQLIKQLTIISEHGYGNAFVWYRDENSIDYYIEEGVYDTWIYVDKSKHVAIA